MGVCKEEAARVKVYDESSSNYAARGTIAIEQILTPYLPIERRNQERWRDCSSLWLERGGKVFLQLCSFFFGQHLYGEVGIEDRWCRAMYGL
jgi:hypothetical protein